MASDESMTVVSSMQEDENDDTDDGFEQHPYLHSLSRLSVCTSSMYTNEDEEEGEEEEGVDGIDGVMMNYVSRLSIESFDADDEEFSDFNGGKRILDISSDDDESDKEHDCYSLPATPPRRRNRGGDRQVGGAKDYASDNEAQKSLMGEKMRNLRRRRVTRDGCYIGSKGKKREEENTNSISGDSDQAGGSGGVVVITRPKGGNRSLCMDLEEVKACRDLGFELEHERMLEMPSRLSLSPSTLETTTSSGGTSPISNWCISSPGDDPRDVKARLKVWAQAVALASASSQRYF